jgi:hypothetical protein
MGRFFAVMNLLGLVCSVIGGLFLFYSLTFKPSHFRLVKTGDKKLAMCLDGQTVTGGYGGDLVVSDDPCPHMEETGPTLQVTADRPKIANWGIPLVVLGFILQLPAAVVAVFAAKR